MRGKHVSFLIEHGIRTKTWDPSTKQLHLTFRTPEVRNLFLGLFGFVKSGPERSPADRLVWILDLTEARSKDAHLSATLNLSVIAEQPSELDVFFPDFLEEVLAGKNLGRHEVRCATIPLQ